MSNHVKTVTAPPPLGSLSEDDPFAALGPGGDDDPFASLGPGGDGEEAPSSLPNLDIEEEGAEQYWRARGKRRSICAEPIPEVSREESSRLQSSHLEDSVVREGGRFPQSPTNRGTGDAVSRSRTFTDIRKRTNNVTSNLTRQLDQMSLDDSMRPRPQFNKTVSEGGLESPEDMSLKPCVCRSPSLAAVFSPGGRRVVLGSSLQEKPLSPLLGSSSSSGDSPPFSPRVQRSSSVITSPKTSLCQQCGGLRSSVPALKRTHRRKSSLWKNPMLSPGAAGQAPAKKSIDYIREVLNDLWLFSSLTESQLVDVIKAMNNTTCKPGTVVIKEGEPGESFYVINTGVFWCFSHHEGQLHDMNRIQNFDDKQQQQRGRSVSHGGSSEADCNCADVFHKAWVQHVKEQKALFDQGIDPSETQKEEGDPLPSLDLCTTKKTDKVEQKRKKRLADPDSVSIDDPLTLVRRYGKFMRCYHNAGVFGEIALLYNALRTATVVCGGVHEKDSLASQSSGDEEDLTGSLPYVSKFRVPLRSSEQDKEGHLMVPVDSPRSSDNTRFSPPSNANATLWAVNRNNFRVLVIRATQRRLARYEKLLKQVPLVANLSQENLSKIADALEERVYSKGTFVCRKGEPGLCFYIILKGVAEVRDPLRRSSVTSTSGRGSPSSSLLVGEERHHKVLRVLRKGDYFGEMALMAYEDAEDEKDPLSTTNSSLGTNLKANPKVRTADVVASSELTCGILDGKTFYRLLGSVRDRLEEKMNTYVKTSLDEEEDED